LNSKVDFFNLNPLYFIILSLNLFIVTFLVFSLNLFHSFWGIELLFTIFFVCACSEVEVNQQNLCHF